MSRGCGYLGDEDATVFPNSKEILAPRNSTASGPFVILYAVKIFDVPGLLMSGYEKCLAQFKPLAKKG